MFYRLGEEYWKIYLSLPDEIENIQLMDTYLLRYKCKDTYNAMDIYQFFTTKQKKLIISLKLLIGNI